MRAPGRGVVDLLSAPAVLLDEAGTVQAANEAARAALGPVEPGVTRITDLLEGGGETWATLRSALVERGFTDADVVVDGARRRACHVRLAPAGERRYVAVLDVPGPLAAEIDELRRALATVRDTLARLGASAVPTEGGFFLVDADRRVAFASRRVDELLGTNPVGLAFADVARRFTPPLADAPCGEPLRVELAAADGETHTFEHHCVTLGLPGPGAGTLHGFHDLTAAMARERQLRERDRRLETARVVLNRSQHLRALGELAGEVAHEFGNVLQAIGLHTAVLRRQPGLAEAVTRSVASIKQAVDAGHAYTRRLLTFARDDGGRMEPLDVGAVVRDVAQLVEPRIAHDGRPIQLSVSIPPGLPEIHGSRGKLFEAFLNVFLNALEAMPDGGTLDVSATAGNGEVRIALRDTGAGMDDEAARRAFDPFFTTKAEQAGLGLSTVYGIVRSHGGSVFLESAPGVGTTVCMAFPTAEPPALAATSTGPPAPVAGTRVLVVDDHPAVREATAELLAGQGYEVARAGNVAEALAALGRAHFAVVVADVGLPDRPGWDITRAAKDRSPDTLVALVTGWGFNVSPEVAKSRGVDLVFEKPLDPDALVAAIARALAAKPATSG